MANTLQNNQLTNCCGVYFLHNFFPNSPPQTLAHYGDPKNHMRDYGRVIDQAYIDNTNKTNSAETQEEYKKRIRDSLQKAINSLTNKKSYYIAILNEAEAKNIESILLDVGFEILVPLTKNPTGSSIIMYIYHLLPRPVEKKVVKSVIPRSR